MNDNINLLRVFLKLLATFDCNYFGSHLMWLLRVREREREREREVRERERERKIANERERER
jgi:hypothetical protein